MINLILKEYLEKDKNINSNYDAIISRLKKHNSLKKKIINSAAVVTAIALIGTVSSQVYAKFKWNVQFKEYMQREIEYGVGTKELSEEVRMDYVEQDGIKVKVDSIIMTDDLFEAKINFIFDEDIEVNSPTFIFGFAVYDDENNLYICRERISANKGKYTNYRPFLYKELGLEQTENGVEYGRTAGIGNISATDRNIVSKINSTSIKGFPKSKKIYIRIFNLGYNMTRQDDKGKYIFETFDISDAEWIFEIDIPEKIYTRESEELTLKEEIPGLNVKTMRVTETGLAIQAKMEAMEKELVGKGGYEPEKLISITDNDGNIYTVRDIGTKGSGEFHCTFNIYKDTVNNKQLFLNITVGDNNYSSELIRK